MSPPSRRRRHGVNATASPVNLGDGSQPLRQAVIRVLFATTLVALIAGAMAWLLGAHDVAGIFWATATLVAIVPTVRWVVAALRRGRVGADIIVVLALVGTLAIHEYLAGALIGVMLATGQALEVAAERRPAKDLRSLLERAPRVARRRIRPFPATRLARLSYRYVGLATCAMRHCCAPTRCAPTPPWWRRLWPIRPIRVCWPR